MRKIYTTAVFVLAILIFSCSKDVFLSYERRIVGTWRIIDIDRHGLGNSRNLPFTEGLFTFSEDGRFTWNRNGDIYKGSWDIREEWHDENETVRTLHLTAVDFANQDIRSEYFNEIAFTNTNRFKAWIYGGLRSYEYRFLRQ